VIVRGSRWSGSTRLARSRGRIRIARRRRIRHAGLGRRRLRRSDRCGRRHRSSRRGSRLTRGKGEPPKNHDDRDCEDVPLSDFFADCGVHRIASTAKRICSYKSCNSARFLRPHACAM
jgi:hypothetical protein